MSDKYQGWTNWDTWNANLWLTNDEAIYDAVVIQQSPESLRALFEETFSTSRDFEEAETLAELTTLEALASEGESAAADWTYGATLIRDSYFTEYAIQMADDIGAVSPGDGWPKNCIDWDKAAEELQVDYTPIDFDGVTYWVGS